MEKFTTSSGKPDYFFITTLSLIVIIGLVFLTSASVSVGFQRFGDTYYYLKHQVLAGLLPGLLLFIFFSRFDYHKLKKFALWFFIISLILLGLIFVPGLGLNLGGARRWLALGPFVFQPSELIKLTLVIYLAAWFEAAGENVKSLVKGFLPFVIILVVTLSLIVLQPDLGTTSVVGVAAIAIYLVAGAKFSHLGVLAAGGITALWSIIKIFPHSVKRLTVFLNPELDPQGIGYHINQALLAVGSGGLFGLGLGYSRQKYQYLPEVTGDSIFAIMAEELGFILSVVFLLIIFTFLFRGLRIALRAPDAFGTYLASGIMVWFGWQICINVASMINIMPLTGVPLPFVSAGGSALLTALAACGIVVNISRHIKWNEKN